MQFYALNVPITITVDDNLPVSKTKDGDFKTIYAHIGRDNSIWAAIIEKAYAKFSGNYARIEGGEPTDAISTLTGAPYKRFWHF